MKLLARFSWYLLSCLAFSISQSLSSSINDAQYSLSMRESANIIHVGLTIDHYSIKDALLLINSIISSSINPSYLFFHIVAVDRSLEAAELLKSEITTLFQSCFVSSSHPNSTNMKNFHYEILPYSLSSDSGFYQQMYVKLKKEKHHWNSPLGTDMIRFYLPELFPTLPRLIYIDNDIIITCCLEEIYFHDLQDKVIGIALDDLHWATVTQFKRHYNASHPLVIQHMRYNHSKEMRTMRNDHRAIEDHEFLKAVPRYPNDGVLLFNVPLYRKLQILASLNELAATNAHEYVVNIGTQQFTTLLMYDRWTELTPRANLRHFPNMARGYLMWFYYNGIIHYAGMFKPKLLCNLLDYKENFLRIMTFTPYLLNHYQLLQQCITSTPPTHLLPHPPTPTQGFNTIIKAGSSYHNIENNHIYLKYFNQKCPLNPSTLLILPENLYELLILFRILSYLYNDDPYIYLRIGDFSFLKEEEEKKEEKQWKYDNYQRLIQTTYDFPLWKHRKDLINTTFTNSIQTILASNPIRKHKSEEFIRIYQSFCQEEKKDKVSPSLETDFITLVDQLLLFESIWSFRVYRPVEPSKTKKKEYDDASEQRMKGVYKLLENSIETMPKTISSYKNILHPIHRPDSSYLMDDSKRKKKSPSANERSFRVQSLAVCQKPFLNRFESKPPTTTTAPCVDLLQDIKSEGRRHWEMSSIVIDLKEGEGEGESEGSDLKRLKTTEEVLFGLDLIFMRPRIILIAISLQKMTSQVSSALIETERRITQYLTRQGYIVRQNFDENHVYSQRCEGRGRFYVWGVRMNIFEL